MQGNSKWLSLKVIIAGSLTALVATIFLIQVLSLHHNFGHGSQDISHQMVSLFFAPNYTLYYVIIIVVYILAIGLFFKNLFAAVVAFLLVGIHLAQTLYLLGHNMFMPANLPVLFFSIGLTAIYYMALRAIMDHRDSVKLEPGGSSGFSRGEPGVSKDTFNS